MPKAKQTQLKKKRKRGGGKDGGDGVEERSAEEIVVVQREEEREEREEEDRQRGMTVREWRTRVVAEAESCIQMGKDQWFTIKNREGIYLRATTKDL